VELAAAGGGGGGGGKAAAALEAPSRFACAPTGGCRTADWQMDGKTKPNQIRKGFFGRSAGIADRFAVQLLRGKG
jgi:hypothetical protein